MAPPVTPGSDTNALLFGIYERLGSLTTAVEVHEEHDSTRHAEILGMIREDRERLDKLEDNDAEITGQRRADEAVRVELERAAGKTEAKTGKVTDARRSWAQIYVSAFLGILATLAGMGAQKAMAEPAPPTYLPMPFPVPAPPVSAHP